MICTWKNSCGSKAWCKMSAKFQNYELPNYSCILKIICCNWTHIVSSAENIIILCNLCLMLKIIDAVFIYLYMVSFLALLLTYIKKGSYNSWGGKCMCLIICNGITVYLLCRDWVTCVIVWNDKFIYK